MAMGRERQQNDSLVNGYSKGFTGVDTALGCECRPPLTPGLPVQRSSDPLPALARFRATRPARGRPVCPSGRKHAAEDNVPPPHL